jgi:hypothetical protein
VRYLLAILLFSVLASDATSADSDSIQLALELDLRSHGYAFLSSERDQRAYGLLENTVAFQDNHTLAVSFFAYNDQQPGLSTRGLLSGSPFVFRTLFIDVAHGTERAERSWANAGNYNSFVPLEDGRFLVQSLESITLYSIDLEKLAKRDFKLLGDLYPRFATSPSGRTLYKFQDVWIKEVSKWFTRVDALDQLTLQEIRSLIISGQVSESVSDRQVAYAHRMSLSSVPWDQSSETQLNNLFLKNFISHDRLIKFPKPESEDGKKLARYNCSSATFLSTELLAISGGCSHLVLLQPAGLTSEKIAVDIDFRKQSVGPQFATARQSGKFAFTILKIEHSSKVKNIELNVYDIASRKVLSRHTVRPLPRAKFWFALSPDGTLLALQNDEKVFVWRVP